MGLRHLQVAVWAVTFAAAGSANPLDDGDNDGVIDEMDVCPATAGDVNNFGCPADEEIVRVYGFLDGSWLDDYATCPDGSLSVSTYACPDYGHWGTYYAAHYLYGVHQQNGRKARRCGVTLWRQSCEPQ